MYPIQDEMLQTDNLLDGWIHFFFFPQLRCVIEFCVIFWHEELAHILMFLSHLSGMKFS